jgi:hypothetical protein
MLCSNYAVSYAVSIMQDTGFWLSESCVVVVLQQGRDNDSQQDQEYDY